MFTLQPYKGRSTRFTCPSCHQPHQFTRYIDTQTGVHLADHVGICNHINKCGYHYTPKQYFSDNNLPFTPIQYTIPSPSPKPLVPDFIHPSILEKSLADPHTNNLIKYLSSFLPYLKVKQLIDLYYIGTSSRYNGGTTIFWQIDIHGNIRTGKLIKYDSNTGKRIKKPYVATNWIHAIHHPNKFNLEQCLFGEHLLTKEPTKPIALVESEKTALIAMAKMPDYLWLATGSLHEFKASKLKVLKGRRVIAFPDLNAYDRWLKKATYLDFHIEISNYLEQNATPEQRKQGLDIADFL